MKSIDYAEMQVKTQLSYYFLYLKTKYNDDVAQEETAEVCFTATGRQADAYQNHKMILDDDDNDLKTLAQHSAKAIYELYNKYDGEELAAKKMAQLFVDVAEK